MGFDDVCNTGLVLGLGCEGKFENRLKDNLHPPQNPCLKFDRLNLASLEPSLTLGLAVNKVIEEAQSSPHSTVSSFSNTNHENFLCVKRERDLGSEEIELERVSSRVSDEDEDGSARKKLRLTKEQSALLEDSFKDHSTLNPKQKQALAKQLKLRPRQVEVWFQNRRARTKLKQTEVDCEFLKRCCETLTEENRRLHKELQELKALKFPSPLYMQLPAATLTMCPSCERIGAGAGASGPSGAGENSTKNPYTIAPKTHFYNLFTHSSTAC